MEGSSPRHEDIGTFSSSEPIGSSKEKKPDIEKDIVEKGVINPIDSEKRVTAEEAAKSKAEKEMAMSALMDDMEKSVETQGQWFIKLGARISLTKIQQETRSILLGIGKKTVEKQVEAGFEDQRVFLLRSVVEGTEEIEGEAHKYRDYTMITRVGILTLRDLERNGYYAPLHREITGYGGTSIALDRLIDGAKPRSGTGFIDVPDYAVNYIPGEKEIVFGFVPDPDEPKAGDLLNKYLHATRTADRDSNFGEFENIDFREDQAVQSQHLFHIKIGDRLQPFERTSEEFQKRVKDSIEITESPHKRVVEISRD